MTDQDNSYDNPALAVDAIVEYENQIVLIERSNYPKQWAIPGGFVETGESVHDAVRRELREETNLELRKLHQWKVFSDPSRDPRKHVVSVCFVARGRGRLDPNTDARNVRLFSPIPPWPELAFDHEKILKQYRISRSTPSFNH